MSELTAEDLVIEWIGAAPDWVRKAYRNDQMIHAYICRSAIAGVGPEDGLPKLYEFIYGQYLLSHGQLIDRIKSGLPSRIEIRP